MASSTPSSAPAGALRIRYAALTDVGRRRTVNQDSGYASDRLFILADGMGGAAAGDLASSEVMNIVRRLDAPLEGDPLEALAGAVHRANDRLAEVIEGDSTVEGMGTTLTALLWDGQAFGLAHIGDSRGYRLRDGDLSQITHDHTFVQSLVDEGRISPDEARTHPHRSLILRVLLGADDNEPDLDMVEVQPGDRYLLCSDGLSDMIDDESIREALGLENIDIAAVELVNRALAGGGHDNITCVIAEVVAADDPQEDLAAADGEPMLVGAASEQSRPRTTNAAGGGASGVNAEESDDPGIADGAVESEPDPEHLRYAPREPRRFRWIKGLMILLAVLLLLGVAGGLSYSWTQNQYFVASSDGKVAVYQGVQADVPGLSLRSVYEVSDIELDALPTFRREQVVAGIESSDLQDARASVSSLRELAGRCADPKAAARPGSECEGAS
ncbi:MAG: PP2C family protein-serine/threonine phosphatase [Nocardioidaceae bacterium]